MKKTILLFLFVIGTMTNIQSQELVKGDNLINVGFGLSSYYTSGNGFKTKIPPLEVSYENLITENISVGGFIGMYKTEYFYSYESLDFDTNITFNYINIGVIGNYHFVNDDKFNVYAGARIGYLNSKTKYEESGEDLGLDLFNGLDFSDSGVIFGAQIGARYFISDKIAVNTELGYGIALLKLGASFKL